MSTVAVLFPLHDDPLADLMEAHGYHDAAAEVRGVKPIPYLWHLSQTENDDYDTYSDCVVVAFTEEEAKRIHPRVHYSTEEVQFIDEDAEYSDSSWATTVDNVTAVCLGRAFDCQVPSVVCASFHAG